MSAGNYALIEGRYDEAFDYFSEGHGLGRHFRAQHVAAHRGMMRASWGGRRPGRYLTHLGLWAGAHLTSDKPVSGSSADG